MRDNKLLFTIFLIAMVSIGWGVAFLSLAILLKHMAPMQVLAARWSLTALLFLCLIIFGKVRIDEDVVEMDALTLQGLQDKVLGRPERFLWKGRRAKTVLIAHHHEFIVGALGNEPKPAEYARLEADFIQGIHLLVMRLFHQRAVAVDE